jgi:hypothetical protein
MENRESSQDSSLIEAAMSVVANNVGTIETNDKAQYGDFTNYLGIKGALNPHLKAQHLSVNESGCAVHTELAGTILTFARIVTKVSHQPSGQWMTQTFDGPQLHGGIQQLASDITMAKRYNITLMFDLVYAVDVADTHGDAPGDPLGAFNPEKELLYVELLAELNNTKSTAELGRLFDSDQTKAKLKELDKISRAKVSRVTSEIQMIKDKEVENAPRKKAKSAPRKSS